MFYVILLSGLGAAFMTRVLRSPAERFVASLWAVSVLLLALVNWNLW